MEQNANKTSFLITCVSCIVLLMLMCYLGINTTTKTTSASPTYDCTADEVLVHGNAETVWCCPNLVGSSEQEISLQNYTNTSVECWRKGFEYVTENGYTNCRGIVSAKQDCPEHLYQIGDSYINESGQAFKICGGASGYCSAKGRPAKEVAASQEEKVQIRYYTKGKMQYSIKHKKNTSYKIEEPRDAWIDGCTYDSDKWYATLSNGQKEYFEYGKEYEVTEDLNLYNTGQCFVKLSADAGQGGTITVLSSNGDVYRAEGYQSTSNNCFYDINETTPLCDFKNNEGKRIQAEKDGYVFKGWGTQRGCTSGKALEEYSSSVSFTTYHACYVSESSSSNNYTITYKITSGDAPSEYPAYTATKKHNETYIIEGVEATGWSLPNHCEFVNWEDPDFITFEVGKAYTTNANLTLKALTSCTVKLIFNAQGGIIKSAGDEQINKSTYEYVLNRVSLSSGYPVAGQNVVPEKEGSRFIGWSLDTKCTDPKNEIAIGFYEPVQNFYACWTSNSGNNSSDSGNNSSDSGNNSSDSGNNSLGPGNNSSDSGNNSSDSGNSSSDPIDNPQTGEIAIFMVWVVGISAIVYGVWYFNKLRRVH